MRHVNFEYWKSFKTTAEFMHNASITYDSWLLPKHYVRSLFYCETCALWLNRYIKCYGNIHIVRYNKHFFTSFTAMRLRSAHTKRHHMRMSGCTKWTACLCNAFPRHDFWAEAMPKMRVRKFLCNLTKIPLTAHDVSCTNLTACFRNIEHWSRWSYRTNCKLSRELRRHNWLT